MLLKSVDNHKVVKEGYMHAVLQKQKDSNFTENEEQSFISFVSEEVCKRNRMYSVKSQHLQLVQGSIRNDLFIPVFLVLLSVGSK